MSRGSWLRCFFVDVSWIAGALRRVGWLVTQGALHFHGCLSSHGTLWTTGWLESSGWCFLALGVCAILARYPRDGWLFSYGTLHCASLVGSWVFGALTVPE